MLFADSDSPASCVLYMQSLCESATRESHAKKKKNRNKVALYGLFECFGKLNSVFCVARAFEKGWKTVKV